MPIVPDPRLADLSAYLTSTQTYLTAAVAAKALVPPNLRSVIWAIQSASRSAETARLIAEDIINRSP